MSNNLAAASVRFIAASTDSADSAARPNADTMPVPVASAMLAHTIPAALTDPRYGIAPYCDPSVEAKLTDLSPVAKLEQLIRDELQSHFAQTFTAAKIERELRVGKRAKEADFLFHGSVRTCGHLLGELANRRPDLLTKATVYCGIQRWRIAPNVAGA